MSSKIVLSKSLILACLEICVNFTLYIGSWGGIVASILNCHSSKYDEVVGYIHIRAEFEKWVQTEGKVKAVNVIVTNQP